MSEKGLTDEQRNALVEWLQSDDDNDGGYHPGGNTPCKVCGKPIHQAKEGAWLHDAPYDPMAPPIHTPRPAEPIFTPYVAIPAEGSRIGLMTCLICGAAVLLDGGPIHESWHQDGEAT